MFVRRRRPSPGAGASRGRGSKFGIHPLKAALFGQFAVSRSGILRRDGNEIGKAEVTEFYILDRNPTPTTEGVLAGKPVATSTTAQQIR